jgi:hypothetical protein
MGFAVNYLKNSLFILFLVVFFVFGQRPQNDFTVFEANVYHSQDDMGRIDAFVDPGLPQPAVLSSYKYMSNIGRLTVTKNAGLNQAGIMPTEHNALAISTIKESAPINIKNDILLKLRI